MHACILGPEMPRALCSETPPSPLTLWQKKNEVLSPTKLLSKQALNSQLQIKNINNKPLLRANCMPDILSVVSVDIILIVLL